MNPMTPEALPTACSLYEQFEQPVSRLCRRMIKDRETARDAAQEVWFQLIKSLPGFTGRSSVGTWVWTVARRTIWRHIRREKVYTTRFLAEYFSLREDDGLREMKEIPVEDRRAWIRLQCDECLTGVLHCLRNQDRFIYLLRTLAGLAYAEIGRVMNLREDAVRQIAGRARRRITSFLGSQCMLYNPRGSCRCRMKGPIRNIDATGEYRKVRELSRRITFVKAVESWTPTVEYWRNLISS